MKRTLITVLGAALLVSFVGTASAHIGTNVYPVYELPTSDLPDVRDGTLEDWEDVLPGQSLDHNEFLPLAVADGADIDPSDLAYRVFMAWHSAGNHLYAAIERVDDVYVNTYEGGDPINFWQFDSMEFMVDGDHTGGSYNGFSAEEYTEEERKLLTNFQAQQYVAIPESPDGITMGYQGNGAGWVPFPPFGDAGGFNDGNESPNTAVIELYVTPFDELNWNGPELSRRSTLAAGRIIGFQFSIPDFDAGCASCDPGGYHGFHTLSGQPNTWRLAENFVDGELVGCDTGDCGSAPDEITAVEASSWGRIKAGLR
jgi:hypothetical protein